MNATGGKEITRGDIAQGLKDYHWMMNSIKLLRDSMKDAGEKITRGYDADSDMPKAKGGTSDPVFQEFVRREKRWNKISYYEKKVSVVQERMHHIQEPREIEVLHWLLEGKSYSWIARHMGLSEKHIRRIKDLVLDQMSGMPKMPRKPNSPKTTEECLV